MGSPITASASNVAVTAGAAAVGGRYDVTVNALARTQVTASSSVAADTDSTIVASGGTLTIGGVAVGITGPVTLEGLVSQINNADNIPVSASIVETAANEFRLVLTSTETGVAGAFTVANSLSGATVAFLDTDNDNISGDDEADNAQPAANASVLINGLAVTSSSNTLTTGIPGVTLTLLQLDLEARAGTATSLDGWYSFVTRRLMDASLEKSQAPLDDAVRILSSLREAWAQIAIQPPAASAAQTRQAHP